MTSAIDFAMTHEQIAAELGISPQRVSQLERNALKKIGRRMDRYVKPLEPRVEVQGEESWEIKYDRKYRLACGQSGSINSVKQGEAAGNA